MPLPGHFSVEIYKDGADGLGVADQEGRLQSSGRGLGVS